VITGATGTISKSLRKYLSNILGKHKIKELQKIANTNTLLMQKYKIFNMKSNIAGSINCSYRITITLALETWFVSGI
jgi:hypothetical protein